MISKKLLSEVLSEEISVVVHWEDNYLKYTKSKDVPYSLTTINIYELKHLCKEWAYEKGYDIVTGHDNTALIHNEGVGLVEEWCFDDEAIFKACEWILKETK